MKTQGGHGLRAKYFKGGSLRSERLLLNAELPWYYDDWYSTEVTGYFKAPATADYKFYIAANEKGSFKIFDSADILKGSIETTEISGQRSYWALADKQSTEPIALTKDEFYYIEFKQSETWGMDHGSVAVEIMVDGSSHHHGMKKI